MKAAISVIQDDIIVRYMQEVKSEFLWELRQNISVITSDGTTTVVPIFFQTDFASVPHLLWSIIPGIGKFNLASVLHDYFYTTHSKTRREADREFLIWMDYSEPDKWIRNRVMYAGVRLFGGYRYRTRGN